MATLIDMPKLSDTMTVGTLVKWLKNEGDPVASGDMIAEVETDKATMEVECFDDGVLIKQYCGVGDEVAVGGAIAAVGEAGEEAPAAEQAAVLKPLHSLRKLLPKKASTSLRFMDQVQVAASSRPTSKTPNLAQPIQQALKLLALSLSNRQQRLRLWKSQSPICVKVSARHSWPPRRKPRTSTCKSKSTAHHSQRFVRS
jgi:pyruvate/2-oxoglutarate dehydrogenase complex dihydrolipoamide acyltransferase (E2) component